MPWRYNDNGSGYLFEGSVMKKTRIIKKPHVLEKVVEAFYKREIAKLGGISYKFNSQSRRAVSG